MAKHNFFLPGFGIGFDIKVTGDWDLLNTNYPANFYANQIALVTDNKSTLGFITKHNGFYISNGSVWNKMNFQIQFSDDTLEFRDNLDLNKILKMQLAGLDSSTSILNFFKRAGALFTGTNIQLDIANTPTYQAGQLSYDPVTKTALVDMGFTDTRTRVGQDTYARFFNDTGATLTKGTVINASGFDATNSVLKGIKADNTSSLASLSVLGMVAEDVLDQAVGLLISYGDLNNIDTSSFTGAGPIYLGVGGNLTQTRPVHPNTIHFMGSIVKVHATEGIIFIDMARFRRRSASRSYGFTSQGITAGTFYKGGFYDWNGTSVTLTNASLTQTYGTIGRTYTAHPGIVPQAVGTVDTGQVGIRVTGTLDSETGPQVASQTVVINDDITTLTANELAEATSHFSGQVTFELYTVSGAPTTYSLTFNYGYSKYEDFQNRDVTITALECIWQGNANDSGFDIALLHHKATGWTYAASGFSPGNGYIARRSIDQAIEGDVVNGEDGSWKRESLDQFIDSNAAEGTLFEIITTNNNTIQTMELHLNAVSEELTT